MRYLVLFNEFDHFHRIRLMHNNIGCSNIQIRHKEAVELGAVEQGQGVKTYIFLFVLTVYDTTEILGHKRAVARASPPLVLTSVPLV